MGSIQSPVSFTGNLATKPTASDLLKSSSNRFCCVPFKALTKAQVGAKRRDVTVLAKLEKPLLELENKVNKKKKDLYTSLTPTQIVKHRHRPTFLDHITNITKEDFRVIQLPGRDDPAIVTVLGTIDGRSCMFIGHQKGRTKKEKIDCNIGLPSPHGYQKALRMMEYAENQGIPIVTFVATPGVFADIMCENLGDGEAGAHNLRSMSGLKVPIVSIIIGEGGSGGALPIACADKLLMLENAVFYVAGPEASAAEAAPKGAEWLTITAAKLTELQIADGVIPEPPGGAHEDSHWTSQQLKAAIIESVDELLKLDAETLLKHRDQKSQKTDCAIKGINISEVELRDEV